MLPTCAVPAFALHEAFTGTHGQASGHLEPVSLAGVVCFVRLRGARAEAAEVEAGAVVAAKGKLGIRLYNSNFRMRYEKGLN